jgi:hypothetical protein
MFHFVFKYLRLVNLEIRNVIGCSNFRFSPLVYVLVYLWLIFVLSLVWKSHKHRSLHVLDVEGGP